MKLAYPKFKRALSLDSRGGRHLLRRVGHPVPELPAEFDLKYPGVSSGFVVRVASLDDSGATVRVSAYHPTLSAKQWKPASRAIEHIFGGPRGT